MAAEVDDAVRLNSAAKDITVRGTYDVSAPAGRRRSSWSGGMHADELGSDLQEAYSTISGAPASAAHLKPIWSVMALHRPG